MAVATEDLLGLNRDDEQVVAPCRCRLYRAGHDGQAAAFKYCPLHTAAPELLEALRLTREALLWASGSDDFGMRGKARKGWLKVGRPAVQRASAAIAAAEKE